MLLPIEDQKLIDLVRNAYHVLLLAQAGHQLQLRLGEHLSQGVVGCVEDEDFGARSELAGQLLGVQLPVAAGLQFPFLGGGLQEWGAILTRQSMLGI